MTEIKKKFNQQFIISLKTTSAIQTYADSGAKHLKLIVRPSGSKVYYCRFRKNGTEIKKKLGEVSQLSLSTARMLAENLFRSYQPELDVGRDNLGTHSQMTLNDIFSLYKEHELNHRVTVSGRTHGLEVAYNTHIKKPIGDILINQLTKKLTRDFCRQLECKGYSTHNKVLSVLKAAFNYVIDFEDELNINFNPFLRIKKLQGVTRNRYLTHEEAASLLTALKGMNNQDVADIYRLALFTGARLSNVKSMEWSDINLNSGVWLIPASRTKTKKHYEIPLHHIVLNILSKRKNTSSKFVFPSKVSKYGYITGGDNVWKQAITVAGLYHENPNIRPRPHDLRRTFATWQIQTGADISIVSKALCHTSLKATMIYAHSNTDQVRDSINGAFRFLE